MKFKVRFESLKSISVLILFVYKLMIGSSKNNRENYPRKFFWMQEKEIWVKFNPGWGANRPLDNCTQLKFSALPYNIWQGNEALLLYAFPPRPFAHFLISGYLLWFPDNSNFFLFPCKDRVIRSQLYFALINMNTGETSAHNICLGLCRNLT